MYTLPLKASIPFGYDLFNKYSYLNVLKLLTYPIKIIEPNSTMGNISKRYVIIIKAISISNAWHALYLTK